MKKVSFPKYWKKMQKRWITPLECSSYLSLHIKTIYTKITKGEIPAAHVGGSIRIDKKKLNEQLEKQILDMESKVKDWIWASKE